MLTSVILLNFQVNWSSSSDSDVDHDEGTSNAIGSITYAETVDDVILPLSMLSVDGNDLGMTGTSNDPTREQISVVSSESSHRIPKLLPEQIDKFCSPWRSVLSNIVVWYASYGSNMWKDRFLCYIEGGKV